MQNSKSTSTLSEFELSRRACAIAYGLSKRLNLDVSVARLPLVKGKVCFEYNVGGLLVALGESFMYDGLAQTATRLLHDYQEYQARVHQKGHAGRQGQRH